MRDDMSMKNAGSDLAPGSMVDGRYRVGNLLGRGGTAVVHEATDVQTGRAYALKVLDSPAGGSRKSQERSFLLEAQLATQLTSPHAVQLFQVGMLPDGRPFLVMDRLVGQDVARRLLEKGPMPVMDAVEIVLQACHALAEAHRLGVVHRDIKPGNLFLTMRRDGAPHVRVLDFGLAALIPSEVLGPSMTTLTRTMRVAGSPCYAAPEQIGTQRSVDERADIWGLGIVLYELVLGRRPFEADNLIDTLIAAGSEPVPPMGTVPPEFEAVVRRCLEKDREQRFPNVTALAEALAPFAPPTLADYPDLVRRASGRVVPSPESTQRVLPDDDGPPSAVPSRVNSSLAAPRSSSRGEATSPFVAQVMAPSTASWAGVAAVAITAALALAVVVSHGRAPAPAGSRLVVRSASSAAPSMLLAPLGRPTGGGASNGEGAPDWQAEPPTTWREVP